jgi:hypothetical protein
LASNEERSISSNDMVRVLERLMSVHGTPSFIRMDNGTEMTANPLRDWCAVHWNGSSLHRTSDRHDRTPTWNHLTAKSAMSYLPLKSSQR